MAKHLSADCQIYVTSCWHEEIEPKTDEQVRGILQNVDKLETSQLPVDWYLVASCFKRMWSTELRATWQHDRLL